MDQVERADSGGNDRSFAVFTFRRLGAMPIACTGSAKVMHVAYFLRIICKVTAIKGKGSAKCSLN
jgi:hypothetical protein